MKKRHSEEQIIRILREAERGETSIRQVCRRHKITEQSSRSSNSGRLAGGAGSGIQSQS